MRGESGVKKKHKSLRVMRNQEDRVILAGANQHA